MSKRALVLHLLREAGPRGITTAELIEAGCGSRFGGRIQELRDAGYVIDARRAGASSWVYTLRKEPPAAVAAEVNEPGPLFDLEQPRARCALLGWEDAAA